jgi:hypothetical protein
MTMTQTPHPSSAQRLIGDFAPKLVSLTDDVLFGDIWRRPELPSRDRSLVTVAALITNGSTEQLRAHLQIAKDCPPPLRMGMKVSLPVGMWEVWKAPPERARAGLCARGVVVVLSVS